MGKRGRVEVRLGGPHEGLPADLGLQRGAWHEAHFEQLPYPVLFRVAQESSGRLMLDGLVFGGTRDAEPVEVSSVHLRLPLAELLGQMVQARGLADHPYRFIRSMAAELGDVRRVQRPKVLPGGGPPTRADLENFARVYLGYMADPSTARRSVTATAERLHISRATAHRWRDRAVAAGLLPRRRGGKQ